MRFLAFFVLLVPLLIPGRSWCLEEYATRTGQPCVECHEDPAGGGTLTKVGVSYASGGHVWPVDATATPLAMPFWQRVLRFTLGYLHLVSAIVWFGTIFYVHIVLRPRYAVGGLPKAEMRIAFGAMAVLAATGVPLTKLRFHDPGALLHTRSGVLLLIKVGLFVGLVLSAAYVSLVLTKKLRANRAQWQENNGLEGHPAWVKVGDLLYDVSSSPRWKEGNHFKRHQAGQDMTEALKTAPHGPEKLASFPSFSLADQSLTKDRTAVRTLYVMAYMNLFAALGVVTVIALWRWG